MKALRYFQFACPGRWRKLAGLLLGLGLLATIVGAKSYVIFHFGSDVPYSDEWDKEGGLIIGPYYEGKLHLADLFVPHNEHRIAPTLALDLFWVVCSGQWDARVDCVANTFLAAAIALGWAAFAWRAFTPGWGMALGWCGALLGILPLVWENTLGGFQSQFYFLIGFSLAAIWGLLQRAGSARWWLGLAAAGLAGVSMGSGFLCLLPVALVMVLRSGAKARASRGDWATFVMATALAGIAWAFRSRAPWQNALHAHSAGQFLHFAVRCLAWPSPQWPAWALFIWLPWLAFVVSSSWRRRRSGEVRAEFLFAAGLWVLLQVAGLAFSRGQTMGGMPSNRYGDVSSLSYPINLLALAFLGEDALRRKGRRGLAWGWAAAVAALAIGLAWPEWRDTLPALRAQSQDCENQLRAYVLTGNPARLQPGRIPYPIPAILREIVDRPVIRALLPCSVRAPLALREDRSISRGFAAAGASPATPPLIDSTWFGSYGAKGPAVWRSLPLSPSRFPFWCWQMAGATRPGLTELRLRDSAGRPLGGSITPSQVPGDSWRSAYGRIPPATVLVVEASAPRPGSWLAFGPPAEESGLSEAVRRFCRQSAWIFAAGGAALVLATLSWRRSRPDGGARHRQSG
jgi:hypothetical protein